MATRWAIGPTIGTIGRSAQWKANGRKPGARLWPAAKPASSRKPPCDRSRKKTRRRSRPPSGASRHLPPQGGKVIWAKRYRLFQREFRARALVLRNLRHELAQDCFGKSVVALDRDDEGAGAADNIFTEIDVEVGLDRENGQAV